MAYEKQHFIEEQIVTADDLNHMEEGIAAAHNHPVTSVNGQTGNVIITDVRNSTSGATGLWTFGNSTDGYGFQAGCGGDGFQFNIGRMNNTGPVVMWVNGGTQGGAIYTEGNPPPANPLAAYPVGSIYMSTNATSPASLFGGTWEQLPGDRYLLSAYDAATNSWTGGEMGGAWNYTLVANVGIANSNYAQWAMNGANVSTYQSNHAPTGGVALKYSGTVNYSNWSHSTVVSEINTNSDSVQIVPPYYKAFMWRRTA